MGLAVDDITFRHDYTVHDPYRFPIVDTLLRSPLQAIDFVQTSDEHFWDVSEYEALTYFVELYGIKLPGEKKNFTETLYRVHRLLQQAFREMPHELTLVFEELTFFSPQPTGSIEEQKASEKRYDSLVCFLKEHGTAIDYDKLFYAGVLLFSAIDEYPSWCERLEARAVDIEGIEGSILYYEQYDFGDIVVGDTGVNVYTKDCAVIVDYGGNDIYQCPSSHNAIHVIIDKSGDDMYVGDNYAIGCGHCGISLLIDESGNDTYRGKNFSIGCGVFGIGMVLDKQGDDRYTGDTFTQGAGGFGIGILRDEFGQDSYEGALCAQGFASTYGIGILGDNKGNDVYVITGTYLDEIRYRDHYLSFSQGFSIGFRPDLSAGIGMILDRGGNDYYLGDIFAQGSSYWYGIGAILDSEGNDNYVAYQYAQGAGTHITIGLVVDEQGDDNYVSKGVSQGCGHDLSFGLLLDHEGDDSYVAFDLSQGAGNANGIGMLVDESGDDTYSVKRTHNTQGFGDFRREYGSIGVLLDVTGDDAYTTGKNMSLVQKSRYGICIDWE
jgi:hypothetical protein